MDANTKRRRTDYEFYMEQLRPLADELSIQLPRPRTEVYRQGKQRGYELISYVNS